MFISEEDIKDPVDFEDLKGELSDALWNLTDDLDDETLQKINAALPPFQRVSKITVRTSDFERTPSMKIVRYKKCQ